MPAASLKRYGVAVGTSAVVVVPAVPANRALVVSKLVVSNPSTTTAVRFTAYIGTGTTAAEAVAQSVELTVGAVYAETALVLRAGEGLRVVATTAAGVTVHVSGEESDNA